LWAEIGNAHIYLTKNVCVILEKSSVLFLLQILDFRETRCHLLSWACIAIEKNLQPWLWDSKD
jgi:hypothetical protein